MPLPSSNRYPPERRRVRLHLESLEDRCLLSLGAPVFYTVAPNPPAIATGDFNGDGFTDLVAVGGSSLLKGPVAPDAPVLASAPIGAQITVLLNDGRGVFNDPAFPNKITTVAGATTFTHVAVGDFNGDGKQDIAAIGMSATGAAELFVLFGNGDGTFDATPQDVGVYNVGIDPVAVIAAPLSNDPTHEDLIVQNGAGPNNVTVLVNQHNSSGAFNTAVGYSLGGANGVFGPIAVGDFAGDANLDVAAAQQNNLLVLTGNGTGALTTPPIISNLQNTVAQKLAAGSFTGGAKADLAVGDNGQVIVLQNDGAGSFTPVGQPTATGLTTINSLATGDFTDDGKLDVAVAGTGPNGGEVEVLRGDGQGNLTSDSTASFGVGPISLAAADFNGDGATDLAAADGNPNATSSTSDIAVFLAQQVIDHFTITGVPPSVVAGQSFTFTVTAKDVHGNTIKDYAGTVHFQTSDGDNSELPADYTFQASDNGSHTFTATLNTLGTGIVLSVDDASKTTANGSSAPINVVAAPTPPQQMVAGFQFSGAPSSVSVGQAFTFTVTAVDSGGQTVAGYVGTIAFTSTDASAVLPANFTFSTADNGTAMFTATLNTRTTGAGAVITATDTQSAAITGNSPPIPVNAPAPGAFPPIGPAVAIAPLINGVPTPIETNVVNGSVSVVATQPTSSGKNGAESAAPGQAITSTTTGNKPSAVATGQIAYTKAPFAAVANAGDNSVSILTPNTGGKDGDALDTQQTIANVGNQPRALAVGDFNHNGLDNIAVANFGNGADDDGSVALLFQNPLSTLFSQGTSLTNGVDKPDAIAAGDFNHDDGGRNDDLAVANTGDGTVSIFLNQGGGQFALQQQVYVGPNPTAIVAGDFDGDGNEDLAVATAGDNSVRILYGDGTGHFTASAPILVGNEPSSLAVGDLAGSGAPPDLVVGNFGDSTVSVLVNNHSRATPFQPAQTYQLHANAHPSSVALGNIVSTNAGFPDIVTANADGTMSYLFNQGSTKPDSFSPESTLP